MGFALPQLQRYRPTMQKDNRGGETVKALGSPLVFYGEVVENQQQTLLVCDTYLDINPGDIVQMVTGDYYDVLRPETWRAGTGLKALTIVRTTRKAGT